jgi:hydrogenase/urease accessory protein HupE
MGSFVRSLFASRVWFAFLVVLAVLGAARSARAHEVGLSRSDLRADEAGLVLEVAFARKDLVTAEPSLDADGDRTVSQAEVDGASAAARTALGGLVAVRAAAGGCAAEQTSLALDHEDGAIVKTRYAGCTSEATVDASTLLARLPSGHRHAAFVYPSAGDPEEHVLRSGHASYVTSAFAAAPSVLAPEPPGALEIGWEYFVLGIEHIVFGIDHVVFLFGLILIGGRFKQLALMITAFTASHSITLALAVLGIVAPSPSFVEPVIALSVAYVGVENFLVKDASKRWRIAGIFGLIHGFGFAGALGEVGLPQTNLPLALATFNVGVEVGQLALLAVALPAILALRKREWFMPRGVQALSAAVTVAGLFWFATRVMPGA